MNWNPNDPKSFIVYQIVTGDENERTPTQRSGSGCGCLTLLLVAFIFGAFVSLLTR